ncbi:MAG TPA: glycosyltransferase family 4 protein [bacterium]|nr:glycosyltransferase family 4 protein [bacterium]
MRILVANKFYWPKGGAERVMFDLNRGYEARGHEVVPFSMRSERNAPSAWAKYFVSEIDFTKPAGPLTKLGAALRTIHSREAARSITALVRAARPQVAHLHNFHHQLSPSIVEALCQERVPCVQTLHDYKWICPSYLLFTEGKVCERCKGGRFYEAVIHRCIHGSWAASAAAAVEMTVHRAARTLERGIALAVSPSRFLAAKLAEFGANGERVRVVPNGVDLRELPAASGAGNGFLFAGRLSLEKGIEHLLEAVSLARGVRLAIAGEGPLEDVLRLRAQETAPGRVEFLGALSREQVLQRMRASRALVLPSVCYENAPLAALEALGSGVPVIGTRLGGIPEIVRDRVTGLLVDPADPKSLAAALQELEQDAAEAHRFGENGRAMVAQEYALDHQIESMLAILEEVSSSASR